MNRDNLYQNKNVIEDFSFDKDVSRVFDDMVSRSVPFYDLFQEFISDFITNEINGQSNIYDLGCSTGNTVFKINQKLKNDKVNIYGIDISEHMLKQARKKNKQSKNTIFIKDDISEINTFKDAGFIIVNLTLQFIRPLKRERVLKNIYNSLQPNGYAIIWEKLLDDSDFFTRKYIEYYHLFKKDNNYTEIEISKKREELENVLIPFTLEENTSLLKEVGFKKVSVALKFLNFAIILAHK
ncbi:carboxy-S-adenosyl-L-methionine synthase CmoA [Staphylococcus delphini]|uniref:carboxy-S-adenosyl-L-methionine synthase CmoA n=1 Tax=Staphylococcus delphini TaxID=53344 RepID=UPI0013045E33|nr:carboxy-S-adenosyl-L-methionine synthase CmoA [Staphylococcus delphini]